MTIEIRCVGEATRLPFDVYVGSAGATASGLRDPDLPSAVAYASKQPTNEVLAFKTTGGPVTLREKDEIWSVWLRRDRNHDRLVVIADFTPQYGGPRAIEVPLGRRCWGHLTDRTLHIEIDLGSIRLKEEPAYPGQGPLPSK